MDFLKGKTILLGVTGGIAAYKSVELGRMLKKKGANVITVLTPSAKEFVSEMTFKAAVGNVYSNLFDKKNPMLHISLAKKADVIVIAPATANSIAKICAGNADDLLLATVLATKSPLVIAPAMNQGMYSNAITRKNLEFLERTGVRIVETGFGDLACGDVGKGRLAELELIVQTIEGCLIPRDLSGKKVLVSAGPTREFLDPVRFISSNSSGKMGCAVAENAARRGAHVTLVLGPVFLTLPHGVKVERVTSAREMFEKVLKHFGSVDAFISAASVSDYRPIGKKKHKIKKSQETLLKFVANPDILLEASKKKKRQVMVGFALETQNRLENALKKFKQKKLDLLVLNDETALSSDFSKCTFIDSNGVKRMPRQSKEKTASKLLDRVRDLLKND